MIVNAKGLILGRLASKISEKLLNGEKIDVVNAEKTLITGRKEFILSRYKKKVDATVHSNPHYGPKYPKRPDALFKKAVTGMLPKKTKRGKEAAKRLKVYLGEPEKFNKKEFVEIKEAKSQTNENTVELGGISKLLGAKW